jgi:hypothetical protein
MRFFNSCIGGGVQRGSLGTEANNRPIVPPSGDGEIGGTTGKGKRNTRRKPAPVTFCPPQTPHAARTRTWDAAVGNERLKPSLHGSSRGSSILPTHLRGFVLLDLT